MRTQHLLLIAALLTAGTVHAQSANPADGLANAGMAADLGSTAIGLSMGLSEANPLGLATIPLKLMVKAHIDKMPDENQRREATAQFTGVQFGAAAANICTLAVANPAVAVMCFAGAATWGYSQVKAIPTNADCLNKHMAKFEEAAATGRVYRVVLKDCSGEFKAGPMVAQNTTGADAAPQ